MKSSNKNSSFIKVGKITEGHSLKGEVKVHLFSREAAWIAQLKNVQLKKATENINGSGSGARSSGARSPGARSSIVRSQGLTGEFAVESARSKGALAYVKLVGIHDRTQADTLKGSEFWIPEDLLSSKKGETVYLREILNFNVVSPAGKHVGVVKGFDSNGVQDLIKIEIKDAEKSFLALIPLVKPILVSLDYKSQTIVMDVPEGLIDLYRSEDGRAL